MAAIKPVGYQHNLQTHTAQTDRLSTNALLVPDAVGSLRPRGGLRAPGDLQVTAGSGMSINLSSGGCWVPQAQSNLGGAYNMNNDGTKNMPIGAANASLGRNDLVIARVWDSFYTGTTNDDDFQILPGTAASTPTDPTLPTDSSCLVIARVFVPAGATSSSQFTITPIAPVAQVIGGLSNWTDLLRSTSYSYSVPAGSSYADIGSGNFTINNILPGREIEFEWKVPEAAVVASSSLIMQMLIDGVVADSLVFSTGAAPMYAPARMTGSGIVGSGGSSTVRIQGYSQTNAIALTTGSFGGAAVLRYRVH